MVIMIIDHGSMIMMRVSYSICCWATLGQAMPVPQPKAPKVAMKAGNTWVEQFTQKARLAHVIHVYIVA